MTETNTEVQQEGSSGFTVISAKEQQKRDSIMNELYNDISSSDSDDEAEDQQPAQLESSQTATAASSNSEIAKKQP